MQFPTEPVQNVRGTDHYLVPQSVGIRAVAYVIDSLLFALIVLVVLYALGATQDLLQATAFSWPQLAVIGGQSLYFFVFEAIFGRTPGKFIMQIRVVQADGRRVSVVGAFVRNLVRPLDLVFFGIVGAASILAGFKRQRIGDRLGRTQVVRELPLALVPPPYVPADKASRRCPRCGALTEGERSTCAVCGLDLDSAPPWPFGGIVRPPGWTPPGRPGGGVDARGGPSADRGAAPGTGPRPPAAARLERPVRAAGERPDGWPSYDVPRPAHAAGTVPRAFELHAQDPDTRLFAAREVLLEGSREEVRELARAVRSWEPEDRQFVIDVARTLDGWRPITVLESLRADPDPELAEGAREALATVNERTRREEEERRAREAARAAEDHELDEEAGDEPEDGLVEKTEGESDDDLGEEAEDAKDADLGQPAEVDGEEAAADRGESAGDTAEDLSSEEVFDDEDWLDEEPPTGETADGSGPEKRGTLMPGEDDRDSGRRR